MNMNNTIRTFIAIELSPEIKDELNGVQVLLKATKADVKWTKIASIHLTLKFLGYITVKNIEDVKGLLDKVSLHHKPFELSLSHIGAFPRLENPRVTWVGIDKGSAELQEIVKELEEELSSMGFEKEIRPFMAHLTLGRIRSARGRAKLVSKLKMLDFKPRASCTVDKITIFKSTLTPQGPIYTPLHHSNLK